MAAFCKVVEQSSRILTSLIEDTDNQILDEVVCRFRCDYLRRKLLEGGPGLTLARTLDLAGQCEDVEMQMAKLSADRVDPAPSSGHVNRVKREGGGELHEHKSQPRTGTTVATDVTKCDISAATWHVQNVIKHCGRLQQPLLGR